MVERLNAMNTQTAAFGLMFFGVLFSCLSMVAMTYVGHDAFLLLFGLANQCVGGVMIMLKAASKDVTNNNAPGSQIGEQNIAPTAEAK